ncbi:MAG: PLP-dependent aminotransferase family protein [Hahellaceae bacterium]|nr:PLP-dependent aminotransferase family protein [Anaerolineae bacterium]MCP5162875.1 PLP-dependent aminotransferase family protein [Hahellaceae bacterium]MCP5168928.1 PLP-dependent aminotransferase family protein [Hahellaceae bacterium]
MTFDDTQPLQKQLYQQLADYICSGRLLPGTRLPASRALATELGISRNTVNLALAQLKAEGFLQSRPGSGVYVSDELPKHSQALPRTDWTATDITPSLSDFAQYLQQQPFFQHGQDLPFTPGVPDLAAFPLPIWNRLQRRHQDRRRLLGYHGHQGYAPLRTALCGYLAASRGVRCDPEQIIITQGAQQAIALCAQVFLNPGDSVLVENPGYVGARKAFLTQMANLIPCTLGAHGLDVDKLSHNSVEARLLYLTPTHQYPLGGILSASERLQLLDWASRHRTWLIEDDYDSEFHFFQKPIAALQGMAEHTPVIYMGSFSKVLFPALRLGYLVVPKALVDVFIQAKSYMGGESPTLTQAVVADFIEEGHFVRHLRRMRLIYQEKWQHLQTLIDTRLNGLASSIAASAGMHLAIETHSNDTQPIDDKALSQAFKNAGFGSTPLSFYYLTPPEKRGLVLGFANTRTTDREQGINTLSRLLGQ